MSIPEDTSRSNNVLPCAHTDVSFKDDLSSTNIKLKDSNDAGNSNHLQQQKEMDTIANVFYGRVQSETEEFLQQITKYMLPPNDSMDIHLLRSYEDDQTLSKMRLLLMIHTTCSYITNLLVN